MKIGYTLSFIIACFILACLWPGLVKAQSTPAVHFSATPSWLVKHAAYNKKPSMRTVENGYYYALIEEQVNVEAKTTYNHIITEIVSEAGIQNASQISLRFEPSFERVDFHEITVWRNNKPINRLKKSAFKVMADEQELSSFLYSGSYSVLYILDDIRKGDRIEYSYSLTGFNPIFNDKYCRIIYFEGYQPIVHQFTSLVFSENRDLKIKSFNNAPKLTTAVTNGFKTYTWESFMVPPTQYEAYQPGWFTNFSYVQVSEYKNWNEVARWALGINTAVNNPSGKLKDEIERLKQETGNDKQEYFRKAVTFVQDEIRYMGIEIGEYSHRANNPLKVLSQRYGDCKDKSLLLVSILKGNGIDARIVLVNTFKKTYIENYLPAHNLFNHAVVMAKVNKKWIWVDPTISYQRGMGTKLYFPEYKMGLILQENTTALTAIDAQQPGKINCVETYTVTSENRPVDFYVVTTYTFNQADDMRSRLASSAMQETEKKYLDYYAKIYPQIEAADSIIIDDDTYNNTVTVTEHYTIPDFFEQDSLTNRNTAAFYANYISEQLPQLTSRSKTPVAVNYPYAIDYNIKVILDGGWNVKTESESIKRDFYEFTGGVSANVDTLNLKYHFAYLADHVPAKNVEVFRKDIKKLKDNFLSYSFSYRSQSDTNGFKANTWLLLACGILTVLIALIGVFIYTRKTNPLIIPYGYDFVVLGGWLILILIGLFLTPLANLIFLISENYFDLSLWTAFDNTVLESSYKALIYFEALGNVLIICYAIFCLVLFLNRRDILPKCIIIYFILVTVINFIDYIWLGNISETVVDKAVTNIIRSVIISAIWIPYFLLSSRVKQTFIVPYPSNNYTYEELSVAVNTEQPAE